jgi:hypothetical protein
MDATTTVRSRLTACADSSIPRIACSALSARGPGHRVAASSIYLPPPVRSVFAVRRDEATPLPPPMNVAVESHLSYSIGLCIEQRWPHRVADGRCSMRGSGAMGVFAMPPAYIKSQRKLDSCVLIRCSQFSRGRCWSPITPRFSNIYLPWKGRFQAERWHAI